MVYFKILIENNVSILRRPGMALTSSAEDKIPYFADQRFIWTDSKALKT